MESTSVELLKLVDPSLYYGKFIAGGFFPDERPIDQFKTFSFKRGVVGGVSAGSALVRQGGVTIVCTLHVSLGPCSTQPPMTVRFETNGDELPKSTQLEVSSLIGDLCARDSFFKRESLRSTDTRLEWTIDGQFRVLHADGDLTSAAIGALVAALSDARLPPITVKDSVDESSPVTPGDVEINPDPSTWAPLAVTAWPVASAFRIYSDDDGKQYLLCDPPVDVRPLCSSSCVVVIGTKMNEETDEDDVSVSLDKAKKMAEKLKKKDTSKAKKPKTEEKTILAIITNGPVADELVDRMVSVAERRHSSVVEALRGESR